VIKLFQQAAASAVRSKLPCVVSLGLAWGTATAPGQIDPYSRNQLQLGYDQPVSGNGPQAAYAYYYLNLPEFTSTNVALRLAVAPVYFDGELGLREFLTASTDLGIGIFGGAFGDNYYEVLEGDYVREETFFGHGGGGALTVYQRINPGQLVPLNLVARGGFRYSTYARSCDTDNAFEVPRDQYTFFTRTGLRLAGKEPRLFPDIGLELSVWFERQWRTAHGDYGFDNDRSVDEAVNLYWAYAGFNYAWTNVGHKAGIAFTIGGSESADRFSAWRLGGVLPLVSEFPLILPGYYYQELSAKRFFHLYGTYAVSLDRNNQWQVRFEGATAKVDFLEGLEHSRTWHSGAGVGLVYHLPFKALTAAIRYGYGFNAVRDGDRGAHSVGLLLQYDFLAGKSR
jgi:hypothetical protein